LKGGPSYEKNFIFCGLVFTSGFCRHAQAVKNSDTITETQWHDIVKALVQENWSTAFALSAENLKRAGEAATDPKKLAMLRYVYLLSAAGKVFEGTMTYDELEKAVKDHVGKQIAFPPRPIKLECQGEFNLICGSEKEKNKAMVTASNRKATSIFAFEYIEFKDKVDFAKNAGKKGEITGIIKDIAPNPNKTTIVILRIYVSDGHIDFL
jgi:hypothetical protein